jgi:hypothetical protein
MRTCSGECGGRFAFEVKKRVYLFPEMRHGCSELIAGKGSITISAFRYNTRIGRPLDRGTMSQIFNVYCDESCHLEADGHKAMVLGAIWCPLSLSKSIALRIREIKERHNVNPAMEIKWTKVSPAKLNLYLDLVDYFFDDDDLHFRGVVIPDKSILDHAAHNQTHDDWYYKMYFEMLTIIFSPTEHYRIYIDIKDTWSKRRAHTLWDFLCNSKFDFSRRIIERIQVVRSEHVALVQLADLLIGAVAYINNHRNTSAAKLAIVERIHRRSRYTLTRTTLLKESKFNLLCWKPGGH